MRTESSKAWWVALWRRLPESDYKGPRLESGRKILNIVWVTPVSPRSWKWILHAQHLLTSSSFLRTWKDVIQLSNRKACPTFFSCVKSSMSSLRKICFLRLCIQPCQLTTAETSEALKCMCALTAAAVVLTCPILKLKEELQFKPYKSIFICLPLHWTAIADNFLARGIK